MKSNIKTRRSRNIKTIGLRQLALAFMLPCCLSVPAFALGGPPAAQPGDSRPDPEWSVGPAIGIDVTDAGAAKTVETGLMTAPQDQTKTPAVPATVEVAVGETIGVSVNAAVDYDEWRIPWPDGTGPATKTLNVDFGFATDSVSYAWSGAGTFATPTGSSSNWTAPMVVGTYTLTCTLDDSNTVINLPQTGHIDDGVTPRSVVVKVVPPKEWDIGEGIGHNIAGGVVGGAVSEDGRMTAPQDQTGTPTPAKVVVAPGAKLTPTVEDAHDWDHWKRDLNANGVIEAGEEGVELDEFSYKWTAEGGGTLTDSDKAAAKWTAPLTPGRYRLTCTITDKPAAVNTPNTGTRDDTAPCVRYVDVDVYSTELTVSRADLDDYGASATIAGGGKATDVHKAKVKVTVTDDDGVGVPGITVNAATLAGGGYTTETLTFGATASDGTATATLTSKRLVEATVTVKVPQDSAHPEGSGASVSVEQTWGTGTWTLPAYFEYDAPASIAYTMKMGDGKGIGGHAVTFKPYKLDGYIWDDTAGDDWDDDGFPDGDYVYAPCSMDDPDATSWNAYKGHASFTSKDATGEDGSTYMADLTVAWDDDYAIDKVTFLAWDDSVDAADGIQIEP